MQRPEGWGTLDLSFPVFSTDLSRRGAPLDPEVRILGPRDIPWDLLSQVEELQKRVWGFADRAPCYPARLYRVQARIGGVPLVAVARREAVGFLLALAAYDGKGPYLWSQIMGVAPEWRGKGVARALKWRQREEALKKGLDRVEWTFDPLQAKNSLFNLALLAARGVAYEREVYGGAGGPLYALPADRVRVRWDLESRRVREAAEGKGKPWEETAGGAPVVLGGEAGDGGERVGPAVDLGRREEYLLLRIPSSIQDLLAREDRGEGLPPEERYPAGWAWRAASRAVLEHYLGRGWTLSGAFRRISPGGVEVYQVLERPGAP